MSANLLVPLPVSSSSLSDAAGLAGLAGLFALLAVMTAEVLPYCSFCLAQRHGVFVGAYLFQVDCLHAEARARWGKRGIERKDNVANDNVLGQR